MSPNSKHATTLIEIIIAIIILGMVVFGFYSIQIFSDQQVVQGNRKVKLQNDVSYMLEFMTKNISAAIGDPDNYPVNRTDDNTFYVSTDSNENGTFDGPTSDDRRLAFKYNATGRSVSYCANASYTTGDCLTSWERLSTHITSNFSSAFVTVDPATNYVDINVTACWDADKTGAQGCGSLKNPKVEMGTRMYMPSVSTN